MAVRDYYDAYWSEEGFAPAARVSPTMASVVEDHVSPDEAVLDVGCGDGRAWGAWLDARNRSYTGADVSTTAVDQARARGLDAVVVEDAAELPFADDSFDAVVCIEVLEHLFAPDDAVKEIRRVLRPGGRLIVTAPNVAFWKWRYQLATRGVWNPFGDPNFAIDQPWRDPHIRFFVPQTLARMLAMGDFEVITVGGWGEDSFPEHFRGLRRFLDTDGPGPIYNWLQRNVPSVFALRLYSVARKPQCRRA